MSDTPLHLEAAALESLVPMQDPFLFIRSADILPEEATGQYPLSGDEFFFRGHFKNNPIMPASLMLESLGQLAVLFLAAGKSPKLAQPADPKRIAFLSCDGVRCTRFCKPGDTLTLHIKPKRIRHPLAVFSGHVACGNERVAFAEEISLMFDYLKV